MRRKALGQACGWQHAVQRLARQAGGQRFSRCKQSLNVNAGAQSHGFEHEDQIFGHHIAGGAGGIGAAAQPGLGGIESAYARLIGGQAVGQTQASGIMYQVSDL